MYLHWWFVGLACYGIVSPPTSGVWYCRKCESQERAARVVSGVRVCVCAYVCVYVFVYMCVCACVCMCLYVCTRVHVRAHVYVCPRMRTWIHACVCVRELFVGIVIQRHVYVYHILNFWFLWIQRLFIHRNVIFVQRRMVPSREQTLVVSVSTIPFLITCYHNVLLCRLGPCCVCTVHPRGIFW